MFTSYRRWTGVFVAALLLSSTLQAQEPAPPRAPRVDFRSASDRAAAKTLDGQALRESVARVVAGMDQSAPQTVPQLVKKKRLSRGAKVGIAVAAGFAAGALIGVLIDEEGNDFPPYQAALVAGGIGAGVGAVFGFRW